MIETSLWVPGRKITVSASLMSVADRRARIFDKPVTGLRLWYIGMSNVPARSIPAASEKPMPPAAQWNMVHIGDTGFGINAV